MVQLNERSFHVTLAAEAINAYIKENQIISPPQDLPAEFMIRAGAFVCIKKFGMLRGCIGTIEPCCRNLAEEIIQNAISASTRDPRFPSVTPAELPHLEISVDVLSSPEQVDGLAQLDPKRYGVIVKSGHRRGLLLPDLEGVDSVEQQVGIAIQKAGIMRDEKVELFRFEVIRYH